MPRERSEPGPLAELPGQLRRAGGRAQEAAALALAGRIRAQDPALLARLAELGIVRQAWIDDPDDLPPVAAAHPFEVLARALDSQADRPAGGPLGRGLARLLGDAVRIAALPQGEAELTLCFTDLEGFTRYTALHGDAAAGTLLEAHYQAAGRLARQRNGTVVKRLGDGLLLRFHEPADAVRAALDLVEQAPAPLRVRAGVHTGSVLVVGDDLLGHTVNTTARVADAAHGGQVLVTEDVVTLAGEARGLRFSRGRLRRFKGLPAPLRVRVASR